MKRLVQIADLQQATLCFSLQKSYKLSLKTLQDYNHSLSHYKTLIKQIKSKTHRYCDDINSTFVFKKNKAKKRSVVDYFTIMLENLMEHWSEQMMKVVDVLESAYVEGKEYFRKTQKIIGDSSKMMEQQAHYHQKLFRDYMLTCFPQTDSIFFRLHGADKKFNKKENPAKEAALVQQFKAYEEILECQIRKVDEGVREMREVFKGRTEGVMKGFVGLFEACQPEFEGEFREDELEEFKEKVERRRKQEQKERDKEKDKENEGRVKSNMKKGVVLSDY